MKATIPAAALLALCCFSMTTVCSQDLRTFNQNASRSNHTRMVASDDWTFAVTTGTSLAISSNEKTLFRGNGFASKLSGHYYFDKIGVGISSGILTGSISTSALNRFIAERKFPVGQLQVSKTNPFNSYLLAGPSVRLGNRVSVLADIKGGIFFNNPGTVTINQSGVTRPLYRFEGGDKNMFPGFSGSIGIAYPISSSTQFFINTDYLQSRSSIRLLDPGSGIDIPTQVNRDVKLLTAGIGIIKTFSGTRGSASSKKHITAREASSGLATGRRDLPVTTDNQNCGPVTQRMMNADGSTNEMTFACPSDAADYNRISMNVTVPKQTQGATFGEKVNAGLHAAGSALSQGAALKGVTHHDIGAGNIISGRLSWSGANNSGSIVTNKSVPPKALAGGAGGGAAAASYARQTNASSFGTLVRLYAREAGSGQATGKRERASGIATGRRQYQPVYMDNSGASCNDCLATAKNNPLYTGSGIKGENALAKDKRTMAPADEDGIGSIDILLIDISSDALIAQTKTESNGDFFFANVPDGFYAIKVDGSILAKKGYDISTSTSTDLLGTVTLAPPPVQLYINTEEDAPQQKAGISTSRSNIRTKSLTIVEADLDGDGEFESLTATSSLNDGSTENISATTGNSNGKKTITLEGAALQNSRRRVEVLKSNKQGDPDANRITSIIVSGSGNALTATATFSDGRKQDVSNLLVVNTAHSGVRQYSIMVADLDDDGLADAVVNNETEMETDDMTAGRKMIPVTVPDITGDNSKANVAAPFVPGGVIISAMRPGAPIKGVIVKGGRNPGGDLRTVETNENGEFEFSNLEAGDYTFSFEQQVLISDLTIIEVSNKTKAQDHNSSRSNKTATIIANDNDNKDDATKKSTVGPLKWMAPESLQSISIEADLDGDGNYETDVTAKMSDEIKLDEKGEITAPQQKAGVSTSRSNIRSRNGLQAIGNKIYIGYGTAEIKGKTVPVKIVYKEKATSGLKDTLKTQV